MSASSKKVLGIALGVLLLAAAGIYFVGIPMWEREQAKKIEAFLASLPGETKVEKVTVGLLQRSTTLHGFSGSFPDLGGGAFTVKAEELFVSGLNLAAPTTKGTVTLADKVAAKGVSYSSDAHGFKQTGSIQETSAEGISGDLAALIELEGQKASLLKFFEILGTFRVASSSAKGFNVMVETPSGPVSTSVGSMESKDSSLAGGTFTLSQVKAAAANRDGMKMSFAADKLTGSGVNNMAILEKKVSTVIQSLNMQNMTLVSGQSGLEQTVTAKDMTLRDLRADLGTFVAQMKQSSQEPGKELFSSAFNMMKQLRVGQITLVGYSTETKAGVFGTFGVTVESADARDIGILQCGEANWKGLAINAFGSEKASIGSLSLKSAQFPDIVSPMLRGEQANMNDEEFFRLIGQEKLIIDGFVLNDLRVSLEKDQAITLKSFTLDLDASTANIVVKKTMEELVVPPELYGQFSHEAALFANEYGKPLDISGRSEVEITHDKGKGDIRIKAVSIGDNTLGNAALSADLSFEGDPNLGVFFDNHIDTKLVKAQLSLQDKELLAKLFDVQYKQLQEFGAEIPGVGSGKELRVMQVQGIEASAASFPTTEMKNLVQAVAGFVKESGSLSISVNPPKPVSLQALDNAPALPEGTLGIQAKWVPGVHMTPAAPAQ